MKKRQLCYIAVSQRRKLAIRALLDRANVVRVTDHGTHLKIITRGALAPMKGLTVEQVRDRTTHWDVRYLDFAMEVVRHGNRRKQDPAKTIGVLVHYLANLWGLPESQLLDMLAAQRAYVSAAYTDEEAHGWELPAVRRLQRKQMGGKLPQFIPGYP